MNCNIRRSATPRMVVRRRPVPFLPILALALSCGLHVHAQPTWKKELLHYFTASLSKPDGGYGWEGQPDSHLEPTFAVVGVLNDIGALPADRKALIDYLRHHHPQRQLNKETGPSGFDARSLLYEQIQGIQWLGGDLSEFPPEVSAMKSDTRNLYNYEEHHYGVFDQEALTLVLRHLLQLPAEGYPGLSTYMQERRRANGSFNNAPAGDGGDGNILNTYWGLYALQVQGREGEQKQETIQWLQSCQLKNGGFTHQPHPIIGANDEVAYTWAAVKALQLLSATPADTRACIRYLLSLKNADGGFGNRPGLPSSPMSTYYAIDALKALSAFSSLENAGGGPDRASGTHGKGASPSADLSGYKIFTVQFQAIGNGSPLEAVLLADSMKIQLWGAKNAPNGWVEAAQKIADEKKVGVLFFHADEPYGKNIRVAGMGSFGHILDNYYPAGITLKIPDSAYWQDLSTGFLPALRKDKGGLYLQISNNEPLARMLLDESIRTGGYAAISTIHFNQNFLFFLPFLYQYRHQLPLIALQDAHGTESWWWSNDLLAYRNLYLAKEPTYEGMLDALKNDRIVAVRHDSVTNFKTRMLGGAPGVPEYILSQAESWKWWDDATNDLHHPWAAITVVNSADSFEVARTDNAVVIRIRTWWDTNKQIMLSPLVELKQLFIDDKPVEHEYVELKDRRGGLTDAYYLYHVRTTAPGQHVIRAVCRSVKTNSVREVTEKAVF